MPPETEKYKQAWKKFQDKMASSKKRRFEILEIIYKKLDQQQIEFLRKKIRNNE